MVASLFLGAVVVISVCVGSRTLQISLKFNVSTHGHALLGQSLASYISNGQNNMKSI